jgi:hypothetical protein
MLARTSNNNLANKKAKHQTYFAKRKRRRILLMLRANSSPSLPILPKKTVMDPKYHTLKDIPLKFFYWCFYSRLSAELSSDGEFLNHLSLYPQRQISALNRWSI